MSHLFDELLHIEGFTAVHDFKHFDVVNPACLFDVEVNSFVDVLDLIRSASDAFFCHRLTKLLAFKDATGIFVNELEPIHHCLKAGHLSEAPLDLAELLLEEDHVSCNKLLLSFVNFILLKFLLVFHLLNVGLTLLVFLG